MSTASANPPNAPSTRRDLDSEFDDGAGRKYAYAFDDLMKGFMLRTFQRYAPKGRVLELGCFKGEFTQMLVDTFDDVTAVEGSPALAADLERRFAGSAKIVCGLFEDVHLPETFDTVFLMHGLEHCDDPLVVLRRVKDWLAPGGQLFLACPNANAPSRQIAVRMGLISHNAAVTPAEAEHGHRRTYALDTLRRDSVESGLTVVGSGGIVFKPLANYQLDKAMELGVIDADFLEGCYQLGDVYPDLCATVYVVCTG